MKPDDHLQQLPTAFTHPHLGPPPQLGPHHHTGLTLSESVNQHFDHFAQDQTAPGAYDGGHLAAQAGGGQYAPPQQQVDSSVLQQQQHNFDVQVTISSKCGFFLQS